MKKRFSLAAALGVLGFAAVLAAACSFPMGAAPEGGSDALVNGDGAAPDGDGGRARGAAGRIAARIAA